MTILLLLWAAASTAVGAAASTAVGTAVGGAAAATPGEVPVGGLLREAELNGLNGPSVPLSRFRGSPLIINVWASWCGPCQQEMASLERLAWLSLPVHFKIIGISTDDDADRASALLSRTNATLSHYIDRQLLLENMLGASRLPLTLLIDADGRVLRKIYGAREWDDAESLRLIADTFRAPPLRGGKARRTTQMSRTTGFFVTNVKMP